MSITAAIGVCLDPDQNIGVSCTLIRIGSKDEYKVRVIEGADYPALEIAGMIDAVESCEKGSCDIFTSSKFATQPPGGEDSKIHHEYWEKLKSVHKDQSQGIQHTIRVNFVKHPDTKTVTRLARMKAQEKLSEYLSTSNHNEKKATPAKKDSSKPKKGAEKAKSPILKIKEPEAPEAKSLSKDPARIPIMENLLNGSALERLRNDTPVNDSSDDVKATVSNTKAETVEQSQIEPRGDILQLEIHQDQVPVITRALELFARLGMGQLADLGELIREGHIPVGVAVRKNQIKTKAWAFEKHIVEAEKAIGLEDRSGVGIFDDKTTETAKIAWDLYKSLTDEDSGSMEFAGKVTFRAKINKLN